MNSRDHHLDANACEFIDRRRPSAAWSPGCSPSSKVAARRPNFSCQQGHVVSQW